MIRVSLSFADENHAFESTVRLGRQTVVQVVFEFSLASKPSLSRSVNLLLIYIRAIFERKSVEYDSLASTLGTYWGQTLAPGR